MELTPKVELESRIGNFQRNLLEKQIDGALITQNVDLFYFSGTAQNGYLYIPAIGKPVLLIKRSLDRAREESALECIEPLGSLRQLPATLANFGYTPKALGLELDVLPATNYLFLKELFSQVQITDVSGVIKNQRMYKSQWEIARLRHAGQVLFEVFEEIPEMLKVGMTEMELAGKIEGLARAKGHMGLVRMRALNSEIHYGHLMSGPTGAVPSSHDGPTGGRGNTPAFPQSASWKTIEKNEPILVDYPMVMDGYIVDKTRIFSLGKVDEQLKKAHQVALDIQDRLVDMAAHRSTAIAMYEKALEIVKINKLEDRFMGYKPDQAKFVGHGVGLELDEVPIIAPGRKEVIAPGMVFALEPKFIFPGQGVVGIENTFIVTEHGVELISYGPQEIIEI